MKKDLGKKLKEEIDILASEFKDQLVSDLKEELKEEFQRESSSVKYMLKGLSIKKRVSPENSIEFGGDYNPWKRSFQGKTPSISLRISSNTFKAYR